jgi:D-alanyl-D-alanine dipeptidase
VHVPRASRLTPWAAAVAAAIALSLPGVSASAQPREIGRHLRPPELVELSTLDSTLRFDIRYATDRNFMGKPMYAEARAFLQRPAAAALVRAHRALRAKGVGLLIFDGYRPWSVTKAFWDATPPAKRMFVANPRRGSKHNRGCAVDLSLYDLRTGEEVSMPSAYDEFTARASSSFTGGTPTQRRMRDLLRRAMEGVGYRVDGGEWWHFDHHLWREYAILDIPFDRLTDSLRRAPR